VTFRFQADRKVMSVIPTEYFDIFVRSWRGERRRVLLDFFIDETGRPRMPVVVQASDTLFAAAAVDALDQWRFTAPTRRRQPVAVHVQ
jgi:hypothetical protein